MREAVKILRNKLLYRIEKLKKQNSEDKNTIKLIKDGEKVAGILYHKGYSKSKADIKAIFNTNALTALEKLEYGKEWVKYHYLVKRPSYVPESFRYDDSLILGLISCKDAMVLGLDTPETECSFDVLPYKAGVSEFVFIRKDKTK